MAIKIGGTSIIDDNKNISNVGIVTIGGSTSGTLKVGSNSGIGITATGDGTVSIAGTLYALDVNIPLKIETFDPSHLATNVLSNTNIKIYFNKPISIGSTGFIELKNNSGTQLERINVGAAETILSRQDGNRTLVINPSSDFIKSTPGTGSTIFTVITKDFIADPQFTGINTSTAVGAGSSYKFTIETVTVGEYPYQGGYLICFSGGVQWIAAGIEAEVSRNWYSRADANTVAQTVLGCSSWFVPSCGQLQNPGYTCRTYWDSNNASYWSNTENNSPTAWFVNPQTGGAGNDDFGPRKGSICCVRSFRCVTY
jgi:hypothetical protein